MPTVTPAVLRSVAEGLNVETLEGEGPRAGEVLVRMGAAGVCASDHHVNRPGFDGGSDYLLRILHEYIAHYNAKRPHRTLALDSPDRREPEPKPTSTATAVSRPVLGGLHHEYEWAA